MKKKKEVEGWIEKGERYKEVKILKAKSQFWHQTSREKESEKEANLISADSTLQGNPILPRIIIYFENVKQGSQRAHLNKQQHTSNDGPAVLSLSTTPDFSSARKKQIAPSKTTASGSDVIRSLEF